MNQPCRIVITLVVALSVVSVCGAGSSNHAPFLANAGSLTGSTWTFAGGILVAVAATGLLTFWLTRRFVGGGASKAKLDAVSRSQAVIEFDVDGTIRHANENFLKAMGYTLDEIVGQHHGMFVDPTYRTSVEYQAFWERLRRGEYMSQEYKRFAKGGREIWIQASYNPILGADGRPNGVIKIATDITAAKQQATDTAGQLQAIGKSQAVIEFDMNGVIQHANENFLRAMGYSQDEIRGQHHGMFVEEVYRSSGEYRAFWERLRRGEYVAGEFKRVAKGGREIWIQASYNPILDPNGKPFKVVKYASDITEAKLAAVNAAGQIDAISKSQAMIEFDLDGTIRTANENFLKTLGYGLNEIQGQHHGMFVDDAYRSSGAYRDFWGKLGRGQFQAGRFKRIAKDGSEIWIQASYNPILDLNGKPCKVVKYASDITAQVRLEQDMQELVKFITDAVVQVSDASAQVSAASQTLAEGASTQAASLEETSASLEQITAMVKTNADNARQANELSSMANSAASDGSGIMQKMQVTMNGITEASEKISNIIKVIEEIAFQTNLLALNAAVEAARAGEHGKGFAVVAEEVRNLAQRSAEAAKETTQLISNSVSRAQEGTKVSGEAALALNTIVGHVTRVAGLIEQISAASDEQARGVEQINTAVSEMDKITQQNAATAEESASASEELNSQALSLREACERFQARNRTSSSEQGVGKARAAEIGAF